MPHIGHIEISPGTTFCPDTPENWLNFHRLKRAIHSNKGGAHKPTTAEELNRALQLSISRENKELRSLRTHLPGREPDKTFFD